MGKTDQLPKGSIREGGAQCSAHSKRTGGQCAKPAIPGGTVCLYHGGSAPQVQDAARRRLLAMVDPALVTLEELATDKDVPPPVRLGASKDILDRVGLGAATKHEVDVHNSQEERVAAALAALSEVEASGSTEP